MLRRQEVVTTMLSVAAHMGQAKVRKSNPGLSCSRIERVVGASQSGQNGRSSVALPWKNEGTERLSIDLPLVGRERDALSHRWMPRRGGDRLIGASGSPRLWSILLTFKNLMASSSAKPFSGRQGSSTIRLSGCLNPIPVGTICRWPSYRTTDI